MSIFKIFIIASISILLSACATITEERVDSDNKKIYGIDCSGKAVSMDVCYKKAAALCPGGYKMINSQARSAYDNMPILPLSNIPLKLAGSVTESATGTQKGITIKCN